MVLYSFVIDIPIMQQRKILVNRNNVIFNQFVFIFSKINMIEKRGFVKHEKTKSGPLDKK